MKIMNKLQNRKEELKKNNKGFSLVELIIVIAIMAILVGVVGTQVIPYIEKSRKAKDIQVLSGLCTDAMTAYSSNAAYLTDATYVITIGANVSVTTGTTNKTKLENAFKDLNDYTKLDDLNLESKAGKDISSIEITCQNSGNMITVHVNNTDTTGKYKFEDITSK